MPYRILLVALALVTLTACDTGGQPDAEVTLSGTVTSDESSSKTAAPVEGAVVTAASVSANGSTSAMPGSALTDASGSFSLTTETTVNPVVVSASATGFASRALLEAGAAASTRATAPPMTAETDAEAGVFLLARTQGSQANVADAAFFVTSEVAADLRSGASTRAEVVSAMEAALMSEQSAANREGEDIPAAAPRDQRRSSYASLRAALAGAASAEVRAQAVAQFESEYADAYSRAGLSARANARVGTARAQAVAKFSTNLSTRAKRAVRRRARVAAALATNAAVEAAFEAEGASASSMSILRASGRALLAELEASATDAEMDEAEAGYGVAVRHQIRSEAGVSSFQISAAARASATALAALEAAVSAAGSAEAVATAVATYYTDVESGARLAFADSEFAVEAFTLISLYYSE